MQLSIYVFLSVLTQKYSKTKYIHIRNPTIYYGLSAGGVRSGGDSGSFHLEMDNELSEFYMIMYCNCFIICS